MPASSHKLAIAKTQVNLDRLSFLYRNIAKKEQEHLKGVQRTITSVKNRQNESTKHSPVKIAISSVYSVKSSIIVPIKQLLESKFSAHLSVGISNLFYKLLHQRR